MPSETGSAAPESSNAPKRSLLERGSHLSQIIGSVAVVISLIYVGLQLQQNTAQLQRGENNATVTHFQAIRLAIGVNRDVAELVSEGLSGRKTLDAADQLRLEVLLSEFSWSTFQVWDRSRRGLLDKEEFERGVAPQIARLLCSARGQAWWTQSKTTFVPGFAAAVDKAVSDLPKEACPDYAGPPPP